ncbi:Fur family transcriptional regulator [Spirochaetota bacterium]
MDNPSIIFKDYCKKNGMRYTPERDIIISEIYHDDEHFDVDSLFFRIRGKYPKTKLSKASIYRSIPHLIKAGLIRESYSEGGSVYYEHIIGHSHHDHMKCIGCGKVIEFYETKIDKAQQELCDKLNFEMIWHVHVIGGYCSKCRKKKGSRE